MKYKEGIMDEDFDPMKYIQYPKNRSKNSVTTKSIPPMPPRNEKNIIVTSTSSEPSVFNVVITTLLVILGSIMITIIITLGTIGGGKDVMISIFTETSSPEKPKLMKQITAHDYENVNKVIIEALHKVPTAAKIASVEDMLTVDGNEMSRFHSSAIETNVFGDWEGYTVELTYKSGNIYIFNETGYQKTVKPSQE